MHATTTTGQYEPRAFRHAAVEILRGFSEVDAAYLFGSAATGKMTPGSDFDLALVLNQPLGVRTLDILAAFAREGFDKVDLVVLGEDAVVRFEAVRPNRPIYTKPAFDHGAYYSRAIREYFDLAPILKRQRDALKRRLTNASA